MRELLLKLTKGTMGRVEQTVNFTWVLDNKQMSELATRFSEWAVKVSKMKDYTLDHIGALINQ